MEMLARFSDVRLAGVALLCKRAQGGTGKRIEGVKRGVLGLKSRARRCCFVALGTAAALAISLVLALVIGLFSLRVRAIFYAMITLAVAAAFAVLASQLSDITGGEDGRSFKVPEILQPSFRLMDGEILGRAIDGRVVTYYLVFASALALFLLMLRIVNSPFGRVLQAIRENDFRAEALGYRTVVYRTLANCLGALVATLAVGLKGLRYEFTTQNEGRPHEAIELQLLKGPFRHFAAHWRFSALGEHAAHIEFAMEYEFAGALVSKALGPLFETIADTMVDAFKRRADALYGQAAR